MAVWDGRPRITLNDAPLTRAEVERLTKKVKTVKPDLEQAYEEDKARVGSGKPCSWPGHALAVEVGEMEAVLRQAPESLRQAAFRSEVEDWFGMWYRPWLARRASVLGGKDAP